MILQIIFVLNFINKSPFNQKKSTFWFAFNFIVLNQSYFIWNRVSCVLFIVFTIRMHFLVSWKNILFIIAFYWFEKNWFTRICCSILFTNTSPIIFFVTYFFSSQTKAYVFFFFLVSRFFFWFKTIFIISNNFYKARITILMKYLTHFNAPEKLDM